MKIKVDKTTLEYLKNTLDYTFEDNDEEWPHSQ